MSSQSKSPNKSRLQIIKPEPRWTAADAKQHLLDWQQSGLSIAEFCRRTGVVSHRLLWWKRHHAEWLQSSEDPDSSPVEARWVKAEVGVQSQGAQPEVVLRLRSGDVVEITDSRQTAPSWLLEVTKGLTDQ